MRITFLGGGNMASALIGGMISHGFPPGDIAVIEIGEAGRHRLQEHFGVRCYAAPEAAALSCDVLLLAVKPQQLREACQPLQAHVQTQLVISIAAGVRLTDLSRWLGGYGKLVRAMPNTPALIGAGMTGMFARPDVSAAERLAAERILQAVGETLWVEEESAIDAVTAISGSGPAYVFLFIEALQAAASSLGLAPEAARRLSLQTVAGAARLAAQSEEPAGVLRERVTSKGGTTEAALAVMHEHGVSEGVIAGARAAHDRSCALGALLGKD